MTAASNALRAITEAGAKTPGAASGAVPALASRLAQLASALGKDDPLPAYLPDLLRALRNACAFGDVAATDAACLGDAPVPNALRRLLPVLASAASGATDDGDASVTALAVACQLCANAVRGGSDAASARLWSEVWPRAVAPIAALRGVAANRAHPPLCMMAHARCTRLQSSRLNEERGDGNDEAQAVVVRARRSPPRTWAPCAGSRLDARCGFRCWRRRVTRRWRRGRARGAASGFTVSWPRRARSPGSLRRSCAGRSRRAPRRRPPTATTGSARRC